MRKTIRHKKTDVFLLDYDNNAQKGLDKYIQK